MHTDGVGYYIHLHHLRICPSQLLHPHLLQFYLNGKINKNKTRAGTFISIVAVLHDRQSDVYNMYRIDFPR